MLNGNSWFRGVFPRWRDLNSLDDVHLLFPLMDFVYISRLLCVSNLKKNVSISATRFWLDSFFKWLIAGHFLVLILYSAYFPQNFVKFSYILFNRKYTVTENSDVNKMKWMYFVYISRVLYQMSIRMSAFCVQQNHRNYEILMKFFLKLYYSD